MLTETDSGSLGSNKRSTEADPTSSLMYLKIRELSLYHIRYTALFNKSRNGFQETTNVRRILTNNLPFPATIANLLWNSAL
jgi:hypothetical protein